MSASNDTFTKGVLIEWLAGVPHNANIALEINEFGQLDFIVVDANGQERILRVGVVPPDEANKSILRRTDTSVGLCPAPWLGEETGRPRMIFEPLNFFKSKIRRLKSNRS